MIELKPFIDFMRLNWVWLLSFVTVVGSLLTYVIVQIRAVKRGLQALLRAQMIADYNHYSEKGFAPIYAKQNFENCWINYEALYKNGVMKDIHDRFMALPTGKDE